jgi:hypothetical protein
MKIISFDTFLANAGLRNYLFIQLRTDNGLNGIGRLHGGRKTVKPYAMNGSGPRFRM